MNTTLEYSTRVVQEGDRRCKKSTLNDLAYLTPLRIPLMNPVYESYLSTIQPIPSVTDKKENKTYLIYKEIHMGSGAKSYIRKGFLIYEETRKFFPIFEETASHI